MSARVPPTTAPAGREASATLTPARMRTLQRVCTCGGTGGECAECRRKRLTLQARSAGVAVPRALPPSVEDVLRSPGRPLDPETRAFMEPRFGSDFTEVRIHDDANAAASARDVGAHAYTVGQDIAFASGRYAPGTASGRVLLAHELAHTVQQRGLQRSSNGQAVSDGPEYDRLEREAEQAAIQVVGGTASPVGLTASHPMLSRATAPEEPTIRPAKSRKTKSKKSSYGTHKVQPTEVFESADNAPKEERGTIAEFTVDPFFMPAEKGASALPIYQAMATGGSLESTVALSGGKTKTALWQEREKTGDLRDLWLQKIGWKGGDVDELWRHAGGDAVFPQCNGKTCQMDHIVELQIGGNNAPENVQPLDARENQASGGGIKSQIESLAREVAEDDDFEAGGATQVKLRFKSVKPVKTPPSAPGSCSTKKTRTCLEVEACARTIEVRQTGSGGVEIARVPYPLAAGGRATNAQVPKTFATRPDEEVPLSGAPENEGASTLIPGLLLKSLSHLKKSKGKSQVVSAMIDDRDKTRLPISLSRDAADLTLNVGVGGDLKLDPTSKKSSVGFTYKYLSPGRITEVSVDETGETTWKGEITPRIPFLGAIGVEYSRGNLLVTKGLEEDALKKRSALGMRVTKAQVQMQLGPEFRPSGVIELQMGSTEKPLAKASLTIEADAVGLVARGKLNVNIPKMETAESELTYLGGEGRSEWQGSIRIRSEDIRLPSATVTGGFDGSFDSSGIRFDGAIKATFPGENVAELRLARNEQSGWVLSGDGTFQVPKLEPVNVRVVYYLDEDKLFARGSTGFRIPAIGLGGRLDELTVVIRGGERPRVSGKGGLDFNKGKAQGRLDVEYHQNGKFTGKGSLTYQLRPNLAVNGTVELDAKEKLRITGELTFARFVLFEGYHPPRRNLFTVDFGIPVPGASIGGVGLKFAIRGGVDVGFSFGPGVIEPFNVEAGFNPLEDDPELDLGIGGGLKIPASASLTAKIEGGLALDALIGKIEGGLGLAGTVAIVGGVFAKFEARYKKNRFFAEMTPEIRAELILILALSAYALAQAGWGRFSVRTRKDWILGERTVPTGLDFKLRARFGYDSETGVRMPSLDQIELQRPEITKEKLGLIVERLFGGAPGVEREG